MRLFSSGEVGQRAHGYVIYVLSNLLMERTCIWCVYSMCVIKLNLSGVNFPPASPALHGPLRDLSPCSNLSLSWDKRPLSLSHCSHIPDSQHAHTGHKQTRPTDINSCAGPKHKHEAHTDKHNTLCENTHACTENKHRQTQHACEHSM